MKLYFDKLNKLIDYQIQFKKCCHTHYSKNYVVDGYIPLSSKRKGILSCAATTYLPFMLKRPVDHNKTELSACHFPLARSIRNKIC